jgi:endonuclease III
MDTIDIVYQELEKRFHTFQTPVVELIEAQTKDPFKILITTLLSARTKDQTTSAVVTRLFQQIDTYEDLKKYSLEELEKMIYPVGFYRNKAKYLQKMPYVLEEKFNGIVPETIDQLCELPGVGRKTANLVRAIAFKKPAICVDIHVHRICNRLGYVKTKTPFETEMALRKKLPKEYWIAFNSYLVAFGQNHCTPINPKCDTCSIFAHCKRIGVISKYLHS